MRPRRASMLGPATLVAALLVAHAAEAQACTASATGLSFGTYDPVAPSPSNITGTVSVTCQVIAALNLSYQIQLSAGGGGTFSSRKLAVGSNTLGYQLYTNAARTVVWGDGTGGTGVVSDGYFLGLASTTVRNYTVYGSVPARQNVAPGSYADTITVLVIY